jgi:AbrB family looped-hinge helix DNA binding protein
LICGQVLYRFLLILYYAVDVNKVKLSPKFQIKIPSEIRTKMHLEAGEEMVILEKGGVIQLIRQKPIKQMRGFVKGKNTQNIREEEDRF